MMILTNILPGSRYILFNFIIPKLHLVYMKLLVFWCFMTVLNKC